jgi:hypothetical protein
MLLQKILIITNVNSFELEALYPISLMCMRTSEILQTNIIKKVCDSMKNPTKCDNVMNVDSTGNSQNCPQ